jgi:hypothetical protein
MRAGCSQTTVSLIERGHAEATTIGMLRALFAALEARLQLTPSWRGADLDRLVDTEHAAIVSHLASRLERAGWQVLVEVTYAIGGERGSIDVLGLRPDARAVLVCEVKSDIPAAEATGRKLDEKRRLAPSIARARAGWTPAVVGAALVLPESVRLRRLLDGPAAPLAKAFPVASRAIASWLRAPSRPIAATWFLSDIAGRNARRVRTASRVRNTGSTRPAGQMSSVETPEAEVPPAHPSLIDLASISGTARRKELAPEMRLAVLGAPHASNEALGCRQAGGSAPDARRWRPGRRASPRSWSRRRPFRPRSW